MIELGSGDSAEVGPPGTDVWEVDWDGDATALAIASTDPPGGSGWYCAKVVLASGSGKPTDCPSVIAMSESLAAWAAEK